MIHILAIDIGGTGLKGAVIDADGNLLTERVRLKTPHPCPPEVLAESLIELIKPLPAYERVSVGFPGAVREGKILTAPNLGGEGWGGFNLAESLSTQLGKPVRVVNDAEMQGLGAVAGRGLEVVVTLGTGFGLAIFMNGQAAPHLELSHHPFRKGETYDEQLGNRALEKVGKKRWNRRVRRAVAVLRVLTNFDRLYIGGGNAAKVEIEFDGEIHLIANEAGLKGGAWLWRDRAGDDQA